MMKTSDNNIKSDEACMLDTIEQFIRDTRTAVQHKEDLTRRINESLSGHGRSWAPLYELFKPMGLLPIDAKCNGVKRDAFYHISKVAIGRMDLYLQVMKRLAKECKKKPAGYVKFVRTDYVNADDWNQLLNFFGNLQKANVASIEKNNDCISACPKSDSLRFLDGGWAEDGMVYLVDKTIKDFSKKHGLYNSVFWNVKLSDKPPWNTTNMELDVVAKVGKQFYVFEVKTGALLAIDKWFERWRMFKEVGARYIQCTAKEIDYKLFLPLTLVPIVAFEDVLGARMERDLG